MTDEASSQTQPLQKEEKKPSSSGNNRGSKRQPSNPSNLRGGTSGVRPASGGSSKKAPANTSAAESGSDTPSRKGDGNGNNKKQEQQRGKTGSVRGSGHRKGQTSSSHGTRNASSTKQSPSPALVQSESSDALSSLQRVIQDLRTASPAQQNLGNSQGIYIGLPIQTFVAQLELGLNLDPKHRKAASLGISTASGNFNSYSPHLRPMMEDVEDDILEEGEIHERIGQQQPSHQPRSQSQSFVPPRFAALAAQEDAVGPSGRPQLAPGFMFGARKRVSPVGPPVNEEDLGFQFPQQLQQPFPSEPVRKMDNGEITGIMAEQVSSLTYWFH